MSLDIIITTANELSSASYLHGDMENSTLAYVIANVTDDVMNTSTTTAPAPPTATRLPGLVDKATKDMVVEVVNCYLLPVVFLFGVCGNVMSFVVLVVHGLNNSTNVLLMGLTTSDFFYLVSMFTRKASCIVSKFDYVMSRQLETGLLPTMYMVQRIFNLTTPFITMMITLERCLAVSLPFKVQKLVTPFRMKVAVVSIFLFCAAAISPFFFIYKVIWRPDPRTGDLVPMLAGTPFYYDNYDAIASYNNIALTGIFFFGPMVIVVVSTIFIFVTLKRSAQWRKTTAQGGERSEERRMTKMLMTVVIVYLCMYIPGAIIGIANQVSPDFGSLGGRYNNLFYLVAALQLLLYAGNSSCNFLIYMLFSKKFYNTYLRIFLCQKERKTVDKNRSSTVRNSTKVAVISSTEESSAAEK